MSGWLVVMHTHIYTTFRCRCTVLSRTSMPALNEGQKTYRNITVYPKCYW